MKFNYNNSFLLHKELFSRFPYGVICDIWRKDREATSKITERLNSGWLMRVYDGSVSAKPYLRPLSSMTYEEYEDGFFKECRHSFEMSGDKGFSFKAIQTFTLPALDWLYAKHFDIHGLIEKGLAIEVTEDNNPYMTEYEKWEKEYEARQAAEKADFDRRCDAWRAMRRSLEGKSEKEQLDIINRFRAGY